MKPSNPPLVRPHLTDKVHAALVKAGRPVTRSELPMFLGSGNTAADL